MARSGSKIKMYEGFFSKKSKMGQDFYSEKLKSVMDIPVSYFRSILCDISDNMRLEIDPQYKKLSGFYPPDSFGHPIYNFIIRSPLYAINFTIDGDKFKLLKLNSEKVGEDEFEFIITFHTYDILSKKPSFGSVMFGSQSYNREKMILIKETGERIKDMIEFKKFDYHIQDSAVTPIPKIVMKFIP